MYQGGESANTSQSAIVEPVVSPSAQSSA